MVNALVLQSTFSIMSRNLTVFIARMLEETFELKKKNKGMKKLRQIKRKIAKKQK